MIYFLATKLKINLKEVHLEAEILEHALSEKILSSIDEFLGYPEKDTHIQEYRGISNLK
ncbi:MAG: hypothetical protein EOM67_09990 [Spirochaetia bacterium]|nr:hypothetical protein [Spirochaetia bacterium]